MAFMASRRVWRPNSARILQRAQNSLDISWTQRTFPFLARHTRTRSLLWRYFISQGPQVLHNLSVIRIQSCDGTVDVGSCFKVVENVFFVNVISASLVEPSSSSAEIFSWRFTLPRMMSFLSLTLRWSLARPLFRQQVCRSPWESPRIFFQRIKSLPYKLLHRKSAYVRLTYGLWDVLCPWIMGF